MKNRLPPVFSKHLRVLPQRALKPSPGIESESQAIRMAQMYQKQGRRQEAEQICLAVLKRNPESFDALYVAGTLALDVKDNDLAIQFLSRAVLANPKQAFGHLILAEAYEKSDTPQKAMEHFQQAAALKPGMVAALCGIGRRYVRSGHAEIGLPFFEKASRIDRNHPGVVLGMAEALSGLGRMVEATEYLEAAIRQRNNQGWAWAWATLAMTRKFSGEPAELKLLRDELADPALEPKVAYWLHYAAGKILNDLKRYDEAMSHFEQGNATMAHDFDLEAYRKWVDSMIEWFSPEFLNEHAGIGNKSDIPVFIVGMPRSGTTLTEQICASHPSVYGAGELTDLNQLTRPMVLTGQALVSGVNSKNLSNLAAEYLSRLKSHSSDALRIVDKLPHNFELIGIIALLFPNARIIHCRRDAIDNCLSCYMTDISTRHAYTADLQSLGLYYREYDRLMKHWNAVLPGRIHECKYENMVAEPEKETRRLIEYLGLPWDDVCLRFFDQERTVNTPSMLQVRQPIYKSSVKRWKNYGDAVQPLIDSLGDLAEV
jgi:tetratricopeptide (TPR) repeat protein